MAATATDSSGDISPLLRFMREARVATRLKSEHVVRVHDVGTTERGAPYLVMERSGEPAAPPPPSTSSSVTANTKPSAPEPTPPTWRPPPKSVDDQTLFEDWK